MIDQKVYAESLIDRQKHFLFRHNSPVDNLFDELGAIYLIACKANPEFPKYFLEQCEKQKVSET